jgi:hypothetical protein
MVITTSTADFPTFGTRSTPVVGDGDAVVLVDDDVDPVAVAGQRLIDAVVDDFEDQVVEAAAAGAADVHPGPLPDALKPLENLDLLCVVGGVVHAGICPPMQAPVTRAPVIIVEGVLMF